MWLAADSLTVKICQENDSLLGASISSVGFSVRIQNALGQVKIFILSDLVQKTEAQLCKLSNFGRNSLEEVKTKLDTLGLSLGMVLSENQKTLVAAIKHQIEVEEIDQRANVFRSKNRKLMSEKTKALQLQQIHLHIEIVKLERIGVKTFDQLLAQYESGIRNVRGLGRKSLIRMRDIVSRIDESILPNGDVDWEKYAALAGIPVLPSASTPLATGRDFLASLETVVSELASHYLDAVESAIIKERLMPHYREALTLEELAKQFGVTRERIRQKERNILERIPSAVLDDNYEGLNFRFRTSFTGYWRQAAEYFVNRKSVEFGDLVVGLSTVWHVEPYEVMNHLPLVYSVLTSETSLPQELKFAIPFPSKLNKISAPGDLSQPIGFLNPTRTLFKFCERNNISNVGELLSALTLNRIIIADNSDIGREVKKILAAMAAAVSENGYISWTEYSRCLGIEIVPEVNSPTARYFVDHVLQAISRFIDGTQITVRSKQIFQVRIIQQSHKRKTLDQAATLLGCAGPQIKREESYLLRRVHSAIFMRNLTNSGIRFQDTFISFWKEAMAAREMRPTVAAFVEKLSSSWGISEAEIVNIVPTLAAVIDGRPIGYTSKDIMFIDDEPDLRWDSRPNLGIASSSQSLIVRLRGFRNIH